jgi:hypothetical protein
MYSLTDKVTVKFARKSFLGIQIRTCKDQRGFFSWLLSTTSSFNALKLLHIDHLADAVGKNKRNRRKKIDENKQTVWRIQQQKRIEE